MTCSPSWVPGLLGLQNLLPEHQVPYPTPPPGRPPTHLPTPLVSEEQGLLPAMWLLGRKLNTGLWLLRGRGQSAEGAGQSTPAGPRVPEASLLGSASWDPSQGGRELDDEPKRSQTHPRMPSWPGSCLPRFWALRPYLPRSLPASSGVPA